MADNIAVTAGSGTTIATEDESGVHYQKVKLTASGTGTTADLSVAEDAAHSSGQHGILAMVVRNDSLAALAGSDGDNSPLQVNASGALYVTLDGESLTVASHAVTNAGTFAVQVDGDALTSLQLIDNIVQSEDSAHSSTDAGVMSLAVRNDTLAALGGTDGDYSPLQVNASGALYVDASDTTQPVSGTITANLSATDNAVLDSIDTATTATQAAVETIDNAISGSEMQVDVVAALPAGTNAIGKLAANSGVDIGDVDVTSTSLPDGSGTLGTGRAVNVSADTPVQFGSNSCKIVWVTAETNNSGAIWIGDSNIDPTAGQERGLLLYPGQSTGPLPLSNTDKLYVDAVNSGDGCTFMYVT